MSNNRGDRGPQNLERLHSSMKGYVAQKQQGQQFASGKAANIPDKYCVVCSVVFGSAPPEEPLKPYVCGMCQQRLNEGQTAIVCGNRYGFFQKSDKLADMAGKIVRVLPATMDAFQKEYGDQIKTRTEVPERKLPDDVG